MMTSGVKMAAAIISAELKFRDGQSQKIAVKTENSMTSLISSLHEVTRHVTLLLSTLVEREKGNGVCVQGEEEDSDEDEDDDDEEPQPPEKRAKT